MKSIGEMMARYHQKMKPVTTVAETPFQITDVFPNSHDGLPSQALDSQYNLANGLETTGNTVPAVTTSSMGLPQCPVATSNLASSPVYAELWRETLRALSSLFNSPFAGAFLFEGLQQLTAFSSSINAVGSGINSDYLFQLLQLSKPLVLDCEIPSQNSQNSFFQAETDRSYSSLQNRDEKERWGRYNHPPSSRSKVQLENTGRKDIKEAVVLRDDEIKLSRQQADDRLTLLDSTPNLVCLERQMTAEDRFFLSLLSGCLAEAMSMQVSLLLSCPIFVPSSTHAMHLHASIRMEYFSAFLDSCFRMD
ncbi:unnamed protein product [Protopolystoma xenopodis]|uniref:Uncharacterized protein n=1 Tax=Protopolystoma xenopodis TaxID=117903 RepID=A0A448WY28_9PLAT|nr:unnamed protein product [Protopolystoma xenopodis]